MINTSSMLSRKWNCIMVWSGVNPPPLPPDLFSKESVERYSLAEHWLKNQATVYCVEAWTEEFIFSRTQTCCSRRGAEDASLWSSYTAAYKKAALVVKNKNPRLHKSFSKLHPLLSFCLNFLILSFRRRLPLVKSLRISLEISCSSEDGNPDSGLTQFHM